MSEIPYYFDTPVPRYFRDTGWFDNEHMYKFINWAFSRCSLKSHKIILNGKELILAPFEFVAGRLTSPKECFLTENIFRNQVAKLVKAGILSKTSNSLENKYSCYIWNVNLFSKITNNISKSQQPTDNQQGPPFLTNRITNTNTFYDISAVGFSGSNNQQNNQQITNSQRKNNHKLEEDLSSSAILASEEKSPKEVKKREKEKKIISLDASDSTSDNIGYHNKNFLKFGNFVELRKEAYEKFIHDWGEKYLNDLIDTVNDYCASKPKKYEDYAAALRTFHRNQRDKAMGGKPNESVKSTVRNQQLAEYKEHNGSFNDKIKQF